MALHDPRDFTGALQVYGEILSVNPKDTVALDNAGVSLVKANRFDAARGYLKTAMEAEPHYASPYLIYGQLLHREATMERRCRCTCAS